MSRWGDAGSWLDGSLRREVFFFPSAGLNLYGTIYSAPEPRPFRVVICNSWGFEGDQASRLVHSLAISVARAGGVGMSFHQAGFGDSEGDPAAATVDSLAAAAAEAVRETARRFPADEWTLAGFRLGASVAARATSQVPVDELLLVQPELRPSRYFARLARSARRSAPAPAPKPETAYGYPLPRAILDAPRQADAAVDEALARFGGHGAVVRYAEPAELAGVPPRFEQVTAAGAWRFGTRDNVPLAEGAARWLSGRHRALAGSAG